jgi:hypothetical protein
MRCPVCRAQVEQGPQCRRCRADLALLFQLEEQRQEVLARAYQSLRQGHWDRAMALADGADALRRDAESQRMGALVRLLQGRFDEAWKRYTTLPRGDS